MKLRNKFLLFASVFGISVKSFAMEMHHVNEDWIVGEKQGVKYTVHNQGHEVDRHSNMSGQQCAIRARLMNSNLITSYQNIDNLNKAVGEGLTRFLTNASAFQGELTQNYNTSTYQVNWGNKNNQWGAANASAIKIVLRYMHHDVDGHHYNLVTAYPVI